jgi:phytol kinase
MPNDLGNPTFLASYLTLTVSTLFLSSVGSSLAWINQLNLWVRVGLIGVWVACVFLSAELCDRRTDWPAEQVRKVVHIGVGNVILLAWWLQIPTWIGLLAATLMALTMLVSYWVPILRSINSVGRDSWGTFFYAVSIGVLIAWFWPIGQPEFAVLGVLMMTWGDGFAAIAGQNWGRHPYAVWGMQKSWEGSLTMLAVSFLIALAVLPSAIADGPHILAIAIFTSCAGTLLELISKFGLDNLTVPIGSAAIAYYLARFS